jgi:kinesin family protein 18/19
LPLIDKALDGFNCTLFAYGATGCGKTHTITGTRDDPGIIFRTMEALFNRIESLDCQVDIELGFFEVYNETIRDLLSRSKNLEIREDGSKVVVSGLSIHKPSDVHDVMDLLTSGNENRTKAFTFANSASSRSHAILQIHLSVCRSLIGEKKQTLSSVFSIIDLAGSERAVNTKNMGDRLIEGANINRSLLALGNCFNALASGKSQHVPYRYLDLTLEIPN